MGVLHLFSFFVDLFFLFCFTTLRFYFSLSQFASLFRLVVRHFLVVAPCVPAFENVDLAWRGCWNKNEKYFEADDDLACALRSARVHQNSLLSCIETPFVFTNYFLCWYIFILLSEHFGIIKECVHPPLPITALQKWIVLDNLRDMSAFLFYSKKSQFELPENLLMYKVKRDDYVLLEKIKHI